MKRLRSYLSGQWHEGTGQPAVLLNPTTEEPIAAETLEVREDDVLYCRVKGRFPARFTRAAQAALLLAVDVEGAAFTLRLGDRVLPLVRLATNR